jgi:hypothetical protein
MTFKMEDNYGGRAVLPRGALLEVRYALLGRGKCRDLLGYSIVRELPLSSVADEPDFGVADGDLKRSGPRQQRYDRERAVP